MADDRYAVRIRFEGVSSADAAQMADELREDLLDLTPEVEADVAKDDATTQDFGATLVLVLGAPAVVVIAKGIAGYLQRRAERGGSIVIETPNGRAIATGLTSEAVAGIADALSAAQEQESDGEPEPDA